MPNIILNPAQTVISMNGFSLPIANIPPWYQLRLTSAKEDLEKVLCGLSFPELDTIIARRLDPASPIDWFSDDLTERKPRYSFITDSRNKLEQFKNRLLSEIAANKKTWNRFYFQDVDGSLRPKAGP